jgi:hypothetical protein
MVSVGILCRCSLGHGVGLEILFAAGRHVRYNEQMDRESESCPRKCTYVRANSCCIHQSIDPKTSKLSSIHSRAIELEVKIFFMSDMLMVVVWKDLLMGDILGREVDVREREIDLEDKRERRRRSMALKVLIGLYGRFWV